MSSKDKATPKETAMGFAVLGVIGIIGWNWMFGDDDAPVPPPATVEAPVAPEPAPAVTMPAEPAPAAAPTSPTPEELAEKARAKSYGHHCLSVWDGSHPAFIRAVKATLNDAGSFDHLETITWPVRPDGRNAIVMQFTARNGFGGVVKAKAAGSFDNESCDQVQLDVVE